VVFEQEFSCPQTILKHYVYYQYTLKTDVFLIIHFYRFLVQGMKIEYSQDTLMPVFPQYFPLRSIPLDGIFKEQRRLSHWFSILVLLEHVIRIPPRLSKKNPS